MKTVLIWVSLLSTICTPAFAYGPRGPPERLYYWFAYLADGIVNPSTSARRVVNNGKLALQAVFDRRLEDMDVNRAKFIQNQLFGTVKKHPPDRSLSFKPSRNSGGMTPDSYQNDSVTKKLVLIRNNGEIDSEGSLDMIMREKHVTRNGAKNLLKAAMAKWLPESKQGQDHYAVLVLVRDALIELGCEVPEITITA